MHEAISQYVNYLLLKKLVVKGKVFLKLSKNTNIEGRSGQANLMT